MQEFVWTHLWPVVAYALAFVSALVAMYIGGTWMKWTVAQVFVIAVLVFFNTLFFLI